MTEVKCIEMSGLKLWFPSEDHQPPHFHVERTDVWLMRVFFEEFAMAEMFEEDKRRSKRKVRSKEKKLIMKQVIEHRIELLREWERVHPQ
jgi:Domain of unknown function (DUF4160)